MATMRDHERRRRWLTACLALCVVAGLQLAAVPPEIFAGSLGECVMACSVEGRICCCKGMTGGGPVEPHAQEAETHGRLVSPRTLCRELCATAAEAAGGVSWLLADTRREPVCPAATGRTVATPAPDRRLGHSDPSILPRPPPVLIALF